ncbi:MAG: hypothetical protein ACOYL6_15845 [Bacteriovoracaceae bacterium]
MKLLFFLFLIHFSLAYAQEGIDCHQIPSNIQAMTPSFRHEPNQFECLGKNFYLSDQTIVEDCWIQPYVMNEKRTQWIKLPPQKIVGKTLQEIQEKIIEESKSKRFNYDISTLKVPKGTPTFSQKPKQSYFTPMDITADTTYLGPLVEGETIKLSIPRPEAEVVKSPDFIPACYSQELINYAADKTIFFDNHEDLLINLVNQISSLKTEMPVMASLVVCLYRDIPSLANNVKVEKKARKFIQDNYKNLECNLKKE